MAEISLKIKSEMKQAEADLKSMGATSQLTEKQFKKLQEQMADPAIDKFMQKARVAGIAMTAAKGSTAGLTTEMTRLQREISRLITASLDPMSPAILKMKARVAELDGQLNKTGISFKSLNSIFIAGYNLSGLMVSGLGKVWDSMVSGASSLTEVQNVVDTTFGGSAKQIDAWSKTAISAFGLSELQAKQFTGTLGAMLKSSGIAEKDLTAMSTSVVGLAGDFASFYNLPAEEAFAKLRSGISGETEPLKQLGINMSVANLEAFNLTQGITKQWKSMSQGEQVQSRYNYLMSVSKDAQGDFSKTLETSYANQKRVLSVKFNQMMADLGTKILPVLTSVMKFLNENMVAIGATILTLGSAFAAYMAITRTAAAVTWLMTAAQTALNLVLLLNPIGLVVAAIAGLVVAGIFMYKNWEVVSAKMAGIWDAMKIYAQIGWEYIKIAALTSIKYIIEGLMMINKPFVFVIDNIIKAFNKLTGKEIPTMTQAMGNFTGKIDGMIEKSSKKIEALHNQRMAQLANQAKKENEVSKQSSALAQKEVDDATKKATQQKADIDYFKESLNTMLTTEIDVYAQRLKAGEDFWTKKMEMETVMGSDMMAWQFEQASLIAENDKLTFDQKLAAMKALDIAVQKNAKAQVKTQLQFGSDILSTTGNMLTDIQTVMKNAGKDSYKLAVIMKGLSIAQAGVNTALAITNALARSGTPWMGIAMAAVIGAAGAAQIAAIASTPIPSAETGLTNYTVPDIRSNRNDGAAVMAQGGEEVSITPRGESSQGLTNININVSEQTIFSIVAKGIKTGQIDLNNKNVGRGVFAN